VGRGAEWRGLERHVQADYSQKVLHTELTVAECPKDRLIEVPYAYRLEQLEPSATVERDLRIRGPIFENRPYAMTENRTAIDVSGRLKTVRLQVGVLRRPPGDKAESVFIGCASNIKSEGYTVVTSEKNSSGICFFESVLSASPTRNDENECSRH